MPHDWLLDVLADLRGFARAEGFDRLADQIDEAMEVAERELARGGDETRQPPADLFRPQPGPRRH